MASDNKINISILGDLDILPEGLELFFSERGITYIFDSENIDSLLRTSAKAYIVSKGEVREGISIPLLFLGENIPLELSNHAFFKGRISSNVLKTKIGQQIFERFLGQDSSIQMDNSEKGINGSLKITTANSIGYYTDLIMQNAISAEVNFVSVRNYLNNLLSFFLYLKDAQIINMPLEVDYGLTADAFNIQIHCHSDSFFSEYLKQGLERERHIENPLKGLLNLSLEQTDILDIYYLKKGARFVITGIWLLDSVKNEAFKEVVSFSSYMINQIESFKVKKENDIIDVEILPEVKNVNYNKLPGEAIEKLVLEDKGNASSYNDEALKNEILQMEDVLEDSEARKGSNEEDEETKASTNIEGDEETKASTNIEGDQKEDEFQVIKGGKSDEKDEELHFKKNNEEAAERDEEMVIQSNDENINGKGQSFINDEKLKANSNSDFEIEEKSSQIIRMKNLIDKMRKEFSDKIEKMKMEASLNKSHENVGALRNENISLGQKNKLAQKALHAFKKENKRLIEMVSDLKEKEKEMGQELHIQKKEKDTGTNDRGSGDLKLKATIDTLEKQKHIVEIKNSHLEQKLKMEIAKNKDKKNQSSSNDKGEVIKLNHKYKKLEILHSKSSSALKKSEKDLANKRKEALQLKNEMTVSTKKVDELEKKLKKISKKAA